MSIDFTIDVVGKLFGSNVLSDPSYQLNIPAGFGYAGLAKSRIYRAGTGYSLDDVLTLSGGTSIEAAQIQVTGITNAGLVTSITVVQTGTYTSIPVNPVSLTGGTGSDFKLLASWTGIAQQQILTFIEIFRAYLSEITNPHEAETLHKVAVKMLSRMHFGTSWNANKMGDNAETAAIEFLNGHVLPPDL